MNLYFKEQFEEPIMKGAKECTIRADKNKRWKEGMKIHFRTPRFSKDSRCFAESKVNMIRSIKINTEAETIEMKGVTHPLTMQDGRLESLAKKDGFSSAKEFLDFFRNSLKTEDKGIFEGILIVWNPLNLK